MHNNQDPQTKQGQDHDQNEINKKHFETAPVSQNTNNEEKNNPNHLQVPDQMQISNPQFNQRQNMSFFNSTVSSFRYPVETPEEHAARILKRQHKIHVGLAAIGGAVVSGSIVYSLMLRAYDPAQAQATANNISDTFYAMLKSAWNFVVNLSFLAGIFVGVGIEKSNIVGRAKRFVTGSKPYTVQVEEAKSQAQEEKKLG